MTLYAYLNLFQCSGIKRKVGAAASGRESQAAVIKQIDEVIGKDFYRTDAVNLGYYSKKRDNVADVDPKVRTS